MRCRPLILPPLLLVFCLARAWGGGADDLLAPPLTVSGTVSGTASGEVRVASLEPDGTLDLDDGRHLRLADIDLPRAFLNGKGPATPPAQIQAQRLLTDLAAGQNLRLSGAGLSDRWDRLPIQAVTASGQWLQAALLSQGLARVMPEDGEDDGLLDRLLAIEAAARQSALGLWGEDAFRLKSPAEAGQWLDSVQVFEGVVASANSAGGFVYVNFSENWRDGLSLKISHAVRKAMTVRPPHLDPLRLAGRRLRVRGWVGKGAGPLVEINDPRQIELLETAGTARMAPAALRKEAP